MGSGPALWGTFSVADHLRRRAFVPDVLLYDCLVVPVPDGDSERERWRDIRRDPDRQERLLEILEDSALAVPWSSSRHATWAKRHEELSTSATSVDAAVRDDFAKTVTFDAGNVAEARRSAGKPQGGADSPNPDDPAFLTTRLVLADELGSKKDRALAARIPTVDEVEAVVAYGSYRTFERARGALADECPEGSQPVFKFDWTFLVPSNSERTDDDLLREAVELAHEDAITAWRAAVQRWRRDSYLKGESDVQAKERMEQLIREYAEAARRKKIRVRTRWASAVAAAVTGAAAVVVPPVGAGALFGLGALLPSREVPKRLEAAAMFHGARRRFR